MSKRTIKPVMQFSAGPAGGAALMSDRQKKSRKKKKDMQYRDASKDKEIKGREEKVKTKKASMVPQTMPGKGEKTKPLIVKMKFKKNK